MMIVEPNSVVPLSASANKLKRLRDLTEAEFDAAFMTALASPHLTVEEKHSWVILDAGIRPVFRGYPDFTVDACISIWLEADRKHHGVTPPYSYTERTLNGDQALSEAHSEVMARRMLRDAVKPADAPLDCHSARASA